MVLQVFYTPRSHLRGRGHPVHGSLALVVQARHEWFVRMEDNLTEDDLFFVYLGQWP